MTDATNSVFLAIKLLPQLFEPAWPDAGFTPTPEPPETDALHSDFFAEGESVVVALIVVSVVVLGSTGTALVK